MTFRVVVLAAAAVMASGQTFPDTREIPSRTPQRKLVGLGSVHLEDGSPAPEGTPVQLVCPGLAQTVAFTNAKGNFRGGAVFSSQQTVSTQYPLEDNCRLSAVLPGFVSSVVPSFGGTIVLRPQSRIDGRTASITGLQAPAKAKAFYAEGLRELRRKNYAKAAEHFRGAVELHPLYADAWVELGLTLELESDTDGALRCYRAAAAADPSYIQPPLQMTGLNARLHRWEESAGAAATVIRLDPANYPQAYLYQATAHYNLRCPEMAEKSAREGQRRGNLEGLQESVRAGRKVDAQNAMPKLCRLLAIILAERGDYAGAAEQLRTYVTLVPKAPDVGQVMATAQELEARAASGAITADRRAETPRP